MKVAKRAGKISKKVRSVMAKFSHFLHNNHRQLVRYEKNGLESAFGTKKKHILKNN
jgi:hypothetical protein